MDSNSRCRFGNQPYYTMPMNLTGSRAPANNITPQSLVQLCFGALQFVFFKHRIPHFFRLQGSHRKH